MKNKVYFLGFVMISLSFNAQVGVGTIEPTEKLDVDGTLRVRKLPNDGEVGIYTTGQNTNSGAAATQTFKASTPLMVDADGVMGTTTYGSLVPNANLFDSQANKTKDDSSAMFVIKRFTLEDNTLPDTSAGRYSTSGMDTGMSVANWQGIISNISFKLTSQTNNPNAAFDINQPFNYRLQGGPTGNWKIIGDLPNMKETAFVDILFIKASIVAAEDRSK